jgi:hypothetical protein
VVGSPDRGPLYSGFRYLDAVRGACQVGSVHDFSRLRKTVHDSFCACAKGCERFGVSATLEFAREVFPIPLLSVSHLSLWMSIAAIVVLFTLLLVVRSGRQRRRDGTQLETGRVIAHQLGRIADALERLSLSRETRPSEVPHDGDEKPLRHDGSCLVRILTPHSVERCR